MPGSQTPLDPQAVEAKTQELLENLHAKRMKSFQLLSLPLVFFYLVRDLAAQDFGIPLAILILAFLNNLSSMWTVRHPKFRHLAAHQYIIGLLVLVLSMAMCDGMLQSTALWMVVVGPATACLTMGERAVKAVFLGSVLVVVVPALTETQWPDLLLRELTPIKIYVARTFLLAMLSGIAWLACVHADRQDRWLKTQHDQHNAARAHAATAAASKSEFLATVSHEIRTPMNGILGTAQHLSRASLSSEETDYARIILDSGRNLIDVLNAILDLSKIESGRFALRSTSMRLDHSVRDIVREVSRSVSAEQLSIQAIESKRPLQMQGDPSRIEQVLRNLLMSFVGYAQTQPIEVQLCPEPENPRIEIRVPGLVLDESARTTMQDPATILAKPCRSDQHIALAMKVSHEIIKLMRGTLCITSTPDAGTFAVWTFCKESIHLDAQASLSMSRTLETSLFDAGSLNVLVVDDNMINLRVARRQLEQIGCSVSVANDGQQAVEMCARESYGVVFMDLQMPRLSGIQATQIIRQGEGPNATTPIVAFTADAYDIDLESSEKAGMHGHLAKPFRVTELRRLLNSLEGQAQPGPEQIQRKSA